MHEIDIIRVTATLLNFDLISVKHINTLTSFLYHKYQRFNTKQCHLLVYTRAGNSVGISKLILYLESKNDIFDIFALQSFLLEDVKLGKLELPS